MEHIDEIIRSSRKTFAIVIRRDGTLIVRAPRRATLKQIHEIIERKVDWIREKRAFMLNNYPQAAPKEYVNGESFWYLGKVYPLELVPPASTHLNTSYPLALGDHFYLSRTAHKKAGQVFETWYRKQARKLLSQRLKECAAQYGFVLPNIRITSARTRWGSCSSSGYINFTWRLVMAPMDVIDYVVVHELVHLIVRGHSRAFWDKVKAIMPDYKQREKWLDLNGGLFKLS
jgi:predicted metal-dependent hydrolase